MASIDVNTPAGNPKVQPRIRHHCIVSKLMDVNKSLSEQCKRQLQTTPFGWLLNLHCNIEASGRMLEVMLASWNVDERAFQVGDRLIPFTLYDVALILGLPVRGEPIDCNQSHSGGYAWGKAVYEFLVSGLNRAAASKQAKKARGNLHIQGCTALLQIWACEHLGIGQKNAEINQPFPRFLAWTHQRMFSKKAMEAFSNSANVLSVLVAMPWEQQESVSSKLRWTKREAVERHVKRLEDELNRVKGLVAIVLESSPTIQQNQPPPSQNLEQNQPPIQTQLPIQTPIVDLPSSPSKAVKRGKPAKKKAKAAMVDLASSPSKRDNEGEAAAAVVDLVSSPSKGATTVRYTRAAKTRAQKKWVDAHFLYQPTAHDEAVLADFRKKWSFATRRATRRRPSGVDSNEVAISTETYEITGRDVSSLLGDQAQDESSRLRSWVQLSQLQHKEAKEQERVNNPFRMTSLDQNLCSALVGYAQCREIATGLIAQEFGNAFCWNSITIPCCPKLYKAKTGQFFIVLVAAQFFTGI
uniref:Aminotransferase-like plant mobile domain-containing protein n=1 Tax=Fagus sylvatica TaxID=28930 RepID=A0A2N9ETW2_FAGSY